MAGMNTVLNVLVKIALLTLSMLFVCIITFIRPTPLVAIGNPKGWRNDDYEEGELPRKVG